MTDSNPGIWWSSARLYPNQTKGDPMTILEELIHDLRNADVVKCVSDWLGIEDPQRTPEGTVTEWAIHEADYIEQIEGHCVRCKQSRGDHDGPRCLFGLFQVSLDATIHGEPGAYWVTDSGDSIVFRSESFDDCVEAILEVEGE